MLNFSNDSTVFTRRFVFHRKVNRSVLCPFLTWRCPELMMVSSRLCIVNRRLPVAILRGTRSAQPPIIIQPPAFTDEQGTSDLFTLCHWRGVEDPADHSFKKSKNGYPGYVLAQLVARDTPGRRIGARFCPLVLQVPWLGKRTDELVRKANNAIRLAYFAGAVRPVYQTTRAFSLSKNRLPTLSQKCNDFQWMNTGDGAQYLPGGEVERVTT